ncbi:ABC transporter permease [Eubacteriales bacterium OttesenSCG-928-N13]|nr:ABC transporter permease [Eubacteriales bacterium OttesenSCG-928-N13]
MPFYTILIKYREIGLLIIIALLVALVGIRNPAFVQPSNLLFIVEDTSIMAILAAGMLCVLLVGSIDISIAGIMALSAMVTGVVMRTFLQVTETTAMINGVETVVTLHTSLGMPLLILIGIAVGAVCGLVNGALIAYGKVLPIVTTLGMQYIVYGLCHMVSDGQAVYRKEMSDAFVDFSRVSFLGINSKIWIMLFVFVLLLLFITYFRRGRHLYAVGSNVEAAEMRGIPVNRTIVMAHVIMGALAGLAGLLYGSHDTKITQDMAMGYEMYVIAACVIGGVAVTGGSGKIFGVLLGALTIGVINNGLTMMRLTGNSEFWKKAIQGALILIAVVSNVLIQRTMHKQNLRRRNI